MRDLNTVTGHSLRRPSFSNTLSELPEVDEPESARESPFPGFDVTSFPVLPPISVDETVVPSPRPRFHTMPHTTAKRPDTSLTSKTMTKSSGSTGDIVGVAAERRKSMGRRGLGLAQTSSNLTSRKNSLELTNPFPTRVPSQPAKSEAPKRRGSLNSRDIPIYLTSLKDDPPVRQGQGRRQSQGSVCSSPDYKHQTTPSVTISSPRNNETTIKPETTRLDTEPHAQKKDEIVLRWRNAAESNSRRSSQGSVESLISALEAARPVGRRNQRRRSSIPSEPVWARRWSNPEFAETDRRVDLLMKYGKALRQSYTNLPTDNDSPPLKTVRTLADFMMEIPKQPRFSSFMSPEAQYSLMKGYEDTLYRKLSNSVPEYNVLLKRNKTPNSKIDIKTKNTLNFLDSSDDDDEDEDDDDDESSFNYDQDTEAGKEKSATNTFLTQPKDSPDLHLQTGHHHGKTTTAVTHNHYSPSVKTESSTYDAPTESSSGETDQRALLRSLRRLSVSLERGGGTSKPFHEEEDEEEDICSSFTRVRRSCSLPNVGRLASDRRLALAYRLQAAMDILDNLRPDGEVKLSPRLKVKRGAALAEYNTWVMEWNKEFCVRTRNE